MTLNTLRAPVVRIVAAVGFLLLATQALAFGNWENGDAVYHSVCTNCHNADPTMSSGGGAYPPPAGSSVTHLQTEINANMGSPYTTPYKTASNATINTTVSDVAAYLNNLSYPTSTANSAGFDFGSLATNATSTMSFRITNTGRGPLTVTSVTISDNTNFSVNGSNCTSAAIPATGTNYCTILVTFRPQSAATFTGRSVTVNHNALGGSTVVGNFRGVGTTPSPSFSRSPSTLTFSSRLGQTDGGTVTISNLAGASANLVITSLTFSRSEFTRSGTCVIGGSGLAAGGSCTVNITYTPSALGAQNATLTIGHNDTGSPANVTLNATGTQSLISPTAASLPFSNVQQGNARLLTQSVTNTGTTTLNFTSPLPSSPAALSGANASDFSVSGCASPVFAGLSCTLNITFTPSGLGARAATLTVNSDATNGPLVVSLTGNGVVLPEPTVTSPASDFPDTVINQVSAQTRTITVNNPRMNAIVYSVAAIPDFAIAAESCPTRNVPGGGACTLTISFRPLIGAGEGRRTGSYAFTFTGTGGNPAPDPGSASVAGNALLPLQQSAPSINAAAVVGSPTTSSVVLTNRASTSITLGTLVYSGAAAGDYSLAATNGCTAGLVLAPSTNCTLVTRFNPATAGTRNATLTITHNAAASPQTVQLLGTATPAPQGRIELSAAAFAFADTQLASTSALTVTAHNGGDLALNFSAFTIAGAHAGDFSRAGTCAVGIALPINADCTVVVTFGPTALGTRAAMLSIASDASNGTAVLALTGVGVPIPAPQVSLTPATVDFGTQTIGGLYPSRRVRLVNSGTADLAVASIAVSGAGFANASAAACPAVLVPAAACDIDIAFAPSAAAAFTGTVTVTSNAAGSPHGTALSGAGSAAAIPVVTYVPMVSTLDFGSVSAGSLSAIQTVTIQNQGPGGVTLTVLNAIGPDAASFSVVGGTCSLASPLFEGASCTVDIRFAPGSAGSKTASVQVASTGSFPPVLTLTGVGLAGPNPSFAVSETALAFSQTRVGSESLPATVRLTSSGSGVVTVTAMTVTGPYAVASTTCPALPFTLAAGNECTIAVSFKPNGEGTSAGTLRITTDAAPATREIALSGSGEAQADVTDGGGCTIGDGTSPLDPTLWLTVLAAIAWLWRRERVQPRRQARHGRAARGKVAP